MFGGYYGKLWPSLPEEPAEDAGEKPLDPKRHKAILALNNWKRERTHAACALVIDFIIEELGLRKKYEVPD